MLRLSLSAKLAIAGWTLAILSIIQHVQIATRVLQHLPQIGVSDTDAPIENTEEAQHHQHHQQHHQHHHHHDYGSTIRHYDAIIVGAGWAGLRATQTLLDSNMTNVLLLEANNYVGGRSKSLNEDGSINNRHRTSHASATNIPAELGSEWLYEHNAMSDYLKTHHYTDRAAIIDPKAYSGLLTGAEFYRQTLRADGTLRTKKDGKSHERKDQVWEDFRRFKKARIGELKKRFGKDRDESWGDTMKAYKKMRKYDLTEKEAEYIHLLNDVAKIEYTCDIHQVSLRENDLLDRDVPTTRYMGMRGVGFGNVASQFGRRFQSKIKLNSKVTRIINYQDGDGRDENAIVKYSSNGRIEKVTAKTVLVTASLGVLKAGNIKFTPPLPEYKREVIDGMGFGVVNKCAMYWNDDDDIPWPKDEFWFKLIRSDEETKWTYFFNPSSYKRTSTLTAWIGGDDAVEMESRTDDEVVDRYVMPNLEAMFPGIRRPDRTVVTRWGSEENILGTYSYKVAHRDFDDDAEDLKRRIGRSFFAGEATAGKWLGTTIGAWDSGEEAAEGMMKYLREEGDGWTKLLLDVNENRG